MPHYAHKYLHLELADYFVLRDLLLPELERSLLVMVQHQMSHNLRHKQLFPNLAV